MRGRYEGEFIEGKFCGVGVLYFPNADVYEGEWKDSSFHGIGKFTRADGGCVCLTGYHSERLSCR
mgnify:CR=1 FL=1